MSKMKWSSLTVFLGLMAVAADGRATEREARHHLDIGPSLAFIHIENGDGPNLSELPVYGGHVGYRYRALPWLELGGSAMFRASGDSRFWLFPAVVGFRLPLEGGHGLFANIGAGYYRYDGEVPSHLRGYPWKLEGPFGLFGLGGTVQIANTWSLTGELGVTRGFGTIRSDQAYLRDAPADTLSGYLDIGARYSF